MARFAQELLSSSSLTLFPFDPGAPVPERVYRLFCDAVVGVPHGRRMDSSVSDIVVDNGCLRFSLSCNGEKLSFEAYSVSGGHYSVLRSGCVSVVVDLDHLRDSERFSDPGDYRLSESCASYECRSVSSFSILNSPDGKAEPVVTNSGISGLVSFVPGTNMSLSMSESGVSISAIPGAGKGVVPCECPDVDDEEESVGVTIVPSSTKDVVIEGDGCIQVNTDNTSLISINGRCTACCPTDKYVEELNELAGLSEVLKAAKEKVFSVVDDFNESATDFNEAIKEPSIDELHLSVTAYGPHLRARADEWSNMEVVGLHQKVYVGGTVVNASQSEVSVRVYPPLCEGMECKMIAVSLSEEVSDTGVGSRRVLPNVNSSFKLKPGGSASIYGILVGNSEVAYMEEGTYTVSMSANFTWTGVEKEIDGDKVKYVKKTKSSSKVSSVDFEVRKEYSR